jgi:hypothetical protein
MKRQELGPLAVILFISVLLSVSSLTRGQFWGDDFASYVMQAQSILNSTTRDFVQHNTFTIQNSSYPPGPVAYPWGFPVLLAPFIAVFGLKFLALKLINTFFFLLFLIIFYLLARLRLPSPGSLALTAILGFSPALLFAHDILDSDIPFLFASTLGILLIELHAAKSARGAILTGLAIYFAFSLRTNGVLLLVPLLVSQILDYQARSTRSGGLFILLLPWLVFAALVLFEALLLPSGQGSYLSHLSMLTGGTILYNLLFYLLLPAGFFRGIPLGPVFAALLLLPLIFELLVGFRKDRLILSYIAASLGLFILWPENQGLRFIYPLLPLFLLLAAEGLSPLMERLPVRAQGVAHWTSIAVGATLILLSLAVSADTSLINLRQDRQLNGPTDPVSRQMFEFIREKTPPESVIIFFKPRAMRLFTGRDSFMTQRCEDLPKGDYIVTHEKQGSNAQIADIATCPGIAYPVVFNNQRFTVYEVAR